jgi:hypothetical protein
MKKYIMVVVLGLFFSCASKHFSKDDYTLYDENFELPKTAPLRTDGVYILNSIWTNENGGITKKPDTHKFYKFYPGGQCNMLLDPDKEITSDGQYKEAVNVSAGNKGKTLFEGYYKLQGSKIIIQSLQAAPLKQFEYKYGYITNEKLVIVKATIEGKGKFDDKYFTDYYKEEYSFLPLQGLVEAPNW